MGKLSLQLHTPFKKLIFYGLRTCRFLRNLWWK